MTSTRGKPKTLMNGRLHAGTPALPGRGRGHDPPTTLPSGSSGKLTRAPEPRRRSWHRRTSGRWPGGVWSQGAATPPAVLGDGKGGGIRPGASSRRSEYSGAQVDGQPRHAEQHHQQAPRPGPTRCLRPASAAASHHRLTNSTWCWGRAGRRTRSRRWRSRRPARRAAGASAGMLTVTRAGSRPVAPASKASEAPRRHLGDGVHPHPFAGGVDHRLLGAVGPAEVDDPQDEEDQDGKDEGELHRAAPRSRRPRASDLSTDGDSLLPWQESPRRLDRPRRVVLRGGLRVVWRRGSWRGPSPRGDLAARALGSKRARVQCGRRPGPSRCTPWRVAARPISVATSLNRPKRLVPIAATASRATMAIRATMRPYSTIVAPSSRRRMPAARVCIQVHA